MRIHLWHGYLLGGTGSNVYTRALAREWSLAGHEVTVVCQERDPEQYDLAGARFAARWGTPEEILAHLRGFEAAGIEHLTVNVVDPPGLPGIERFARVIEAFRR